MTGGLQGQVLQALLDFGALDLEDRAFRAGALAAGLARQGAQLGELQGRQIDFQLRDLAAEEGVLDQGAALVRHLVGSHLAQALQASL